MITTIHNELEEIGFDFKNGKILMEIGGEKRIIDNNDNVLWMGIKNKISGDEFPPMMAKDTHNGYERIIFVDNFAGLCSLEEVYIDLNYYRDNEFYKPYHE